MELHVHRDDKCPNNTGGGYRYGDLHIHYDGRLDESEQEQVVIMEALGCKLGMVMDEMRLNDLADFIQDALMQWRDQRQTEGTWT